MRSDSLSESRPKSAVDLRLEAFLVRDGLSKKPYLPDEWMRMKIADRDRK